MSKSSGVHKRPAKPACSQVNSDRGSRFVDCPLCGARVAWHAINVHLDTIHCLLDEKLSGQPARSPVRDLVSFKDQDVHQATAERHVSQLCGCAQCGCA